MPFPEPETALGRQTRAERTLEVIREKKRAPGAFYQNRTYTYIFQILPQQLTAGFNNLHETSTTYERTEWRLRTESLRRPSLRLGGLFLATLRRRCSLERMEKPSRDHSDFIDGSLERGFIGLRRFVKSADLSHELQRRGANLVGIDGRTEIDEGFDISAHQNDVTVRTLKRLENILTHRSAFIEDSEPDPQRCARFRPQGRGGRVGHNARCSSRSLACRG